MSDSDSTIHASFLVNFGPHGLHMRVAALIMRTCGARGVRFTVSRPIVGTPAIRNSITGMLRLQILGHEEALLCLEGPPAAVAECRDNFAHNFASVTPITTGPQDPLTNTHTHSRPKQP